MILIEWNKVTWYSKLLTVIVFIVMFLTAFDLGTISQQAYTTATPAAVRSSIASTCAITTVTRAVTASTTRAGATGSVGARCGGFIRNAPQCAVGFHCRLGRVADLGGVCVANASSSMP